MLKLFARCIVIDAELMFKISKVIWNSWSGVKLNCKIAFHACIIHTSQVNKSGLKIKFELVTNFSFVHNDNYITLLFIRLKIIIIQISIATFFFTALRKNGKVATIYVYFTFLRISKIKSLFTYLFLFFHLNVYPLPYVYLQFDELQFVNFVWNQFCCLTLANV